MTGVSGSGKSTVAAALAAHLGWPYVEGDDLHPDENIAAMAAGHPLTDAQRAPWLATIRSVIDERLDAGGHAVLTCSALRRSYREVLRRPGVRFVLLDADPHTLAGRVAHRPGHFMPAVLLTSQLDTLERPTPDEHVLVVDATRPVAELVRRIEHDCGLSAR